jgi:hypothetical protein
LCISHPDKQPIAAMARGSAGVRRPSPRAPRLLRTTVALLGAAHATPSEFSATVLADGRLPSGGHYRTEYSDVEIDRLIIRRGGNSGWHSHEGSVLLVAKQGRSLTTSLARAAAFKPGWPRQTLLEYAGETHMARNGDNRDVVVIAVVNYRKGGSSADDASRPAVCDV